ncbi:hypothetical protein [Halobellus rarus]|uniref:DUF8053 domain-containing protein n=1 Tax=Halobellus rarus TaxID=1126237 RepID=A0ABD6CTI6_9EURY|nr:hypothetical protein [Halobellus rarus]
MQKLRDDGGSGLVTVPKRYLEKDDVLEDGDIPGEIAVDVERLDRRTYAVRISEDGEFPDLQETEFVERIVGQRLFSEGFRPGSAD